MPFQGAVSHNYGGKFGTVEFGKRCGELRVAAGCASPADLLRDSDRACVAA